MASEESAGVPASASLHTGAGGPVQAKHSNIIEYDQNHLALW